MQHPGTLVCHRWPGHLAKRERRVPDSLRPLTQPARTRRSQWVRRDCQCSRRSRPHALRLRRRPPTGTIIRYTVCSAKNDRDPRHGRRVRDHSNARHAGADTALTGGAETWSAHPQPGGRPQPARAPVSHCQRQCMPLWQCQCHAACIFVKQNKSAEAHPHQRCAVLRGSGPTRLAVRALGSRRSKSHGGQR